MNPAIALRPSVLLTVAHKELLAEHLQCTRGKAALWIPGFLDRSTGETVDIEIALAKERMLFHCRGVIRWKRLRGQPGLPAGIGIELVPEHDHTCELLLEFAKSTSGEFALAQRRHRRFPAVVPATIRYADEDFHGATLDVSRSGACLKVDKPANALHRGAQVTLRLELPEPLVALEVRALVRWLSGNDITTFGLQFDADEESQSVINAFISAIKRQLSGREQ